MSEKERASKGLRCTICTGCGLCPGTKTGGYKKGRDGLRVLSEDALLGQRTALCGGGRRLATVDVGTTTVAMLLYADDGSVEDRFAAVNPQTRYGADVISRIRAAEHADAAAEMQRLVCEVLERGIRRFCSRLKEGESLFVVLAANTVMTTLLRGRETAPLGRAPFRVPCLGAERIELAGAPCLVFPGMSAFVGGDIVAGVCACGMEKSKELTLLIDLGTNGELVLGNCDRRLACATAAGPAFEGGVNSGIWGADMIALLATLKRQGILDETGLLKEPYFERGIRIGNVLVTQQAVRSIQLAKGAVAAGTEILLERYGITADEVGRVVLAGGFGYYLNPQAAAQLGLLPEKLAKKAVSGGNTALTGALLAGRRWLACGDWRSVAAQLEETAGRTETLNLAQTPEFEEKYIAHLNFGEKAEYL